MNLNARDRNHVGDKSSGPIGLPVAGLSGGGNGFGRSAEILYQVLGILFSSNKYLIVSVILIYILTGYLKKINNKMLIIELHCFVDLPKLF